MHNSRMHHQSSLVCFTYLLSKDTLASKVTSSCCERLFVNGKYELPHSVTDLLDKDKVNSRQAIMHWVLCVSVTLKNGRFHQEGF
jgi:hypothetical protein